MRRSATSPYVQTIDKFEAHAEIVMGYGLRPGRNVRAFDARDISSTSARRS